MSTPPTPSRLERWLKSAVARGWLPFDLIAPCFRPEFRALRAPRRATTFTEKVCYKLAHDRRPIARVYADKLAVRDHVRSVCSSVKLPRLLAHFDRAEDVLAQVPPAPWIMKASHGSGMVLICDRPGAVSPSLVYDSAKRWLRRDYAVRFWEWQYLRLPRRILFEEYLGQGRRTPDDYKLYVMHQKVQFIEIDQGRYIRHTRDFFWPDWTPIRSRIGPAPTADMTPRRPAELGRLIQVAEALAQGTDFVRVDLYLLDGEVYFGELTHSPAAGSFGFADPELDVYLGSQWELPARYVDPLPAPAHAPLPARIPQPAVSIAS